MLKRGIYIISHWSEATIYRTSEASISRLRKQTYRQNKKTSVHKDTVPVGKKDEEFSQFFVLFSFGKQILPCFKEERGRKGAPLPKCLFEKSALHFCERIRVFLDGLDLLLTYQRIHRLPHRGNLPCQLPLLFGFDRCTYLGKIFRP